jgi:hypothetical protein
MEIIMPQGSNLAAFLIKTIARFVVAAMILAAVSAHAQTRTDAAISAHPQPGIHKAPSRGGQGNDHNWLQGGGG